MEQALFRQEAIDARRGEWLGTINVATPLSRWALTSLGLALAATIVGFLVFGHYTRRERVTGQLVPSMGLLAVNAVNAGVVARVFVHEGQPVRKGDPLVELSSESDSATLGDTRARISAQLRSQRARLQADLVAQKQGGVTQKQALEDKVGLLRAQLVQIDAQQVLQKQQVASEQSLLQRIQPLRAKGYVSAFQVQQQEAALLQAQGQLKTLDRQRLDVRQQLGATRQQLQQLPLDLGTRGNEIARKLADIDQQLAQNEAQRAVVLRAPRDGTVSALLLKEGQPVAGGQSLLSILPRGAALQAQLLVPSRAVGFIESGSRVVLRYQAFPYQKFGQQYGSVEQVSRSALSTSEVAALTGRQAQQPLYRVKVTLDRQDILAYGEPQVLKAGMALEADILMDRRSLLEWAFEPLYGLGHQVLGERQNHG